MLVLPEPVGAFGAAVAPGALHVVLARASPVAAALWKRKRISQARNAFLDEVHKQIMIVCWCFARALTKSRF